MMIVNVDLLFNQIQVKEETKQNKKWSHNSKENDELFVSPHSSSDIYLEKLNFEPVLRQTRNSLVHETLWILQEDNIHRVSCNK